MPLSDTDRAVVLDLVRTYLTGVVEVRAFPQDIAQEEALHRRMLLVDETLSRASRDPRISPEGRALLMTRDRLKVWLEAEMRYLSMRGVRGL